MADSLYEPFLAPGKTERRKTVQDMSTQSTRRLYMSIFYVYFDIFILPVDCVYMETKRVDILSFIKHSIRSHKTVQRLTASAATGKS